MVFAQFICRTWMPITHHFSQNFRFLLAHSHLPARIFDALTNAKTKISQNVALSANNQQSRHRFFDIKKFNFTRLAKVCVNLGISDVQWLIYLHFSCQCHEGFHSRLTTVINGKDTINRRKKINQIKIIYFLFLLTFVAVSDYKQREVPI